MSLSSPIANEELADRLRRISSELKERLNHFQKEFFSTTDVELFYAEQFRKGSQVEPILKAANEDWLPVFQSLGITSFEVGTWLDDCC